MAPTVLVVDDKASVRKSLDAILADEGYRVMAVSNGTEAIEAVHREIPDAVLLDVWMPGPDGIDVLKEIRAEYSDLPVIIISGHGTIETAVKATKLGAYDFLEKPLSTEKTLLTVARAIEHHQLAEANRDLRRRILGTEKILGSSPAVEKLKDQIKRVAPTDGWVLITGENGTGKELVARSIHGESLRSDQPFVDVNCAAIPEELIESELFGHEKGVFTGATDRKRGKFDLAHRGTIFLDEIADMSLKTQAKILRILQEQKFERVGGGEPIQVDVRVIVATNKDLEEEIAEGRFREDLYYRLNVIPIHVPPLRERAEDIPFFLDHFAVRYSRKVGVKRKSFAPDAVEALMKNPWPGNVREIKNLVERLVIMVPRKEIRLKDLPAQLRGETGEEGESPFGVNDIRQARTLFEKEFLVHKLIENGSNISRTAEVIGIERSTLHRKIKTYGIELDK